MKRFFAAFLIVLFCAAPLASCAGFGEAGDAEITDLTTEQIEAGTEVSTKDKKTSEAVMLTFMSYNIEMYGHPDSAKGWNGRDPAKAMETVLDVSPDILGLQEVNLGWSSSVSAMKSKGYTWIMGDISPVNRPDLLYKTEKFDELNSGFERYKELVAKFPRVSAAGADMKQDQQIRLFTWALLQEKITGKKILAISTHLHYRKNSSEKASSEENTLVRQYEIRLLLAWIGAQTFDYDCVVVMGDMNDDYSSGSGMETIDVFRDGGFSVTRDSAASKGDTGGTLDGTDRTVRQQWIFDYILTKGNVQTDYYTVIDNKNDNDDTSYPSDHLPIMARITCR